MLSDINKILHQQCNIELQTNRKISVKSVNNCNSYSVVQRGPKNEVSTVGNDVDSWLLNGIGEEISNNKLA